MADNRNRKNAKSNTKSRTLRVKTTLGDLLAAAFDVAGGSADRTAELLTRGPLGQIGMSRKLRFV